MKITSAGPLRFFADENISVNLVRLLREYEGGQIEICACEEHFDRGTPDEEWLRPVGSWEPQPAILGGDGRILSNPVKLAALKAASLHYFLFAEGYTNLSWHPMVMKTIEAWPHIRDAAGARAKTIFKVTINSKVEPVCRLDQYEQHGKIKRKGRRR